MIAIVLIIGLLALMFGPSLWTKWVLRKHGRDRVDFPGTGGELARHLLDGYKLQDVPVEITDRGDHYDPTTRTVRLSEEFYHGRSLTAITVAAHEVGHAIQDRDGYEPLRRRTTLITSTFHLQRLGMILVTLASFISVFFAGPLALVIGVIGVFLTGLLQVLVHISTLPVELDASFNRALPILEHGGYLPQEDLEDARTILKACAYTYVAAALRSILNILYLLRR